VATTRPLEIEVSASAEGAVMTLTGELDIATVPQLAEAVESALAGSPAELVLDLRPLSFVDSSGLREFILLADRAEQEGWRLALVRPGGPALAVFQITRADENLPFVEEVPPR
jgi:anti-sigma B factor antagonist